MSKPPATFNDLGFSVSFVCDTLEALPTSGSLIHFTWPRRNRAPYPGGILMRVSPQNGPAWVGQFEPDDPYFPSGAYACPSGDALLVVSEGNGYIVSVADPTNYETVKSPLLGVARVPARPLVFAWTEQDLLAFDESGEKWWIENLAVDGLRITEISSSTISGLVANVVTGERCSVTIDVETGSVAGGWPTDSEGGISARVHTRGGET